MEQFNKLTTIDKAILLHELFPDEIYKFLLFLQKSTMEITEDEARFKIRWEEQELSHTADIWIHKAAEIKKRLILQGDLMTNDKLWFASQLFDQHYEYFTLQFLTLYWGDWECDNRPFEKIIEGFFDVPC